MKVQVSLKSSRTFEEARPYWVIRDVKGSLTLGARHIKPEQAADDVTIEEYIIVQKAFLHTHYVQVVL